MSPKDEAQTDDTGVKLAGAQMRLRTYTKAAPQVEVRAPTAPLLPRSTRWTIDKIRINDDIKEAQRDAGTTVLNWAARAVVLHGYKIQ